MVVVVCGWISQTIRVPSPFARQEHFCYTASMCRVAVAIRVCFRLFICTTLGGAAAKRTLDSVDNVCVSSSDRTKRLFGTLNICPE